MLENLIAQIIEGVAGCKARKMGLFCIMAVMALAFVLWLVFSHLYGYL